MATIDSSTLINLAKIDELDILDKLKTRIQTIEEVKQETAEKGIQLGYYDATRIKKIFEKEKIQVRKPESEEEYSGISEVDSKVINLAKETENLFADDVKLGRRAKAENIQVKNTADIFLKLYDSNRMSKKRYKQILKKLVEEKCMTKEMKEKYEKVIEND